jgi:Bacterial sugar transferase
MRNDFAFVADTGRRDLRVAIAHEWLLHEWLLTYAGSERVVSALAEMFPSAEIVTTLVDQRAVPHDLARAQPSFLQHVRVGSRKYHEWFVPVYASCVAVSLDELPQLVNVLRCDISLVGPRPITQEELERYGDKVDQLLGLRPGVTGYWQINGRSRLSYEDRIRLDISYCNNWSLGLDLTILAKTARTLVSERGVY